MRKLLKLSSVIGIFLLCLSTKAFAVRSFELVGSEIDVQSEINLARQRKLAHPGDHNTRFNTGSPFCYVEARGKNALQIVEMMIRLAHDYNLKLTISEINGYYYYRLPDKIYDL